MNIVERTQKIIGIAYSLYHIFSKSKSSIEKILLKKIDNIDKV